MQQTDKNITNTAPEPPLALALPERAAERIVHRALDVIDHCDLENSGVADRRTEPLTALFLYTLLR